MEQSILTRCVETCDTLGTAKLSEEACRNPGGEFVTFCYRTFRRAVSLSCLALRKRESSYGNSSSSEPRQKEGGFSSILSFVLRDKLDNKLPFLSFSSLDYRTGIYWISRNREYSTLTNNTSLF